MATNYNSLRIQKDSDYALSVPNQNAGSFLTIDQFPATTSSPGADNML
jgi:hypothetical protein